VPGPTPQWGLTGGPQRPDREQGVGGASLAPGGPLDAPGLASGAQLARAVRAWTGRPVIPSAVGSHAGAPARADWRMTLRQAARRGAEVVWPFRRPRRRRPIPLVVLWDVSGSMGEYIPLYLPWLAGLARARRQVRVVAFGPTVVDITPLLRDGGPRLKAALRHLSVFGGGTAIGRAVASLLEQGMVRAADAVVIISDGWEGESSERLASALARLRGRARRILWLNPLRATPGYRPVQRGMVVAHRYVDRVAAGANLSDLARLGDEET
jgi:uncharacterized protein with von Willebrand factor type A (vWA) domain